MGLFDFLEGSSNQQAAEQVYNAPADHQSSFGHEAIAGAASFAAVRAYEQHCAQNGKPQSHALALEILAGFAGAEADKLIETKGLNEVDAIKAKRAAKAQAAEALHQSGQFQDEEGYSRHGDYPEERYQGGSGVGDRHWGNDEREHYRQGPPSPPFEGGGGGRGPWEEGRGESHGWGRREESRGGYDGGRY